MTRRKAPLVDAIASIEEARTVAGHYAAIDADIAAIEAERKIRLAEINADCDQRIAGRSDHLAVHFRRLKAWWEAGGSDIAGKNKSAELGGVNIGTRTPPHSLTWAKGKKIGDLVADLKRRRWGAVKKFLRVKTELNKDALIDALKADEREAQVLVKMGFGLSQKDEFFIAPIATTEVEEVAA